ncbi:Dihydrolipoamide acetyltransferase component of pyruvate dehydrogenase complex [Acinetobacter guillouiae MSP4-18]|nr:dihydrolipoyllysine-residue acetyltransferase [Acinetobacter guillouiae CIP 63.46]EPH38649.1 Dihydrolipoamide acetyltransferase component of pyruvate dehydrogenase complex [Acinetobacter guillouiae MSP4-18]KAB0629397.1 pyruvate dehydrogenase complex dihydrolipoyllysine-residue acetyltransferase [Acinetobacter guillouiae]
MMQVKTPDIGVDKATVAEILVKVGDTIAVDESIVLLESDKASVEVPSTSAGVVKSIAVTEGDEVSEGAVLIEVESADATETETAAQPTQEAAKTEPAVETKAEPVASAAPSASTTASSQTVEVQVPDIGVEKALVGEVLVKVGDEIAVDDSIVVVESDKATVEVPSTVAGTVESVVVKEGDNVKEGVVLITVKTVGAATTSAAAPAEAPQQASATPTQAAAPEASAPAQSGKVEVAVPDLGVDKATISEILVSVGDQVEKDQSLCVAESDKASVEVPSTVAGTVMAIHVELNQSVSQGSALVTIEAQGQTSPAPQEKPAAPASQAVSAPAAKTIASTPKAEVAVAQAGTEKLSKAQQAENAKVYAGPAVRKLARELGVVLSQVEASGPHARVMKDDVFAFVKAKLTAPQAVAQTTAAPVASGLPALPDFSAFGGSEIAPMTRLQQVSVPQLSLNNFIPQVTQFDLADITELEAWRGELKGKFKQDGISLTILAFIAKAVAFLLKEEPYFAGHLADDQKSVLLRKEIHMGIAVATPDGLTVPVLRNPDQKSIKQIAIELGELSKKARDKKLSPKDLQGANFTITSLGSIGGTAFTPLVNWPQVAILGISPATMQPVWNGSGFDPKLMLPLSLSYDHRVINGADAARFTNKLTKLLSDIRNILL